MGFWSLILLASLYSFPLIAGSVASNIFEICRKDLNGQIFTQTDDGHGECYDDQQAAEPLGQTTYYPLVCVIDERAGYMTNLIANNAGLLVHSMSCGGRQNGIKLIERMSRDIDQVIICFREQFPHAGLLDLVQKNKTHWESTGYHLSCIDDPNVKHVAEAANGEIRVVRDFAESLDREGYAHEEVLIHEWLHLTKYFGPEKQLDNYSTAEHNSNMVDTIEDRVYSCSKLCIGRMPTREVCESCMLYPKDNLRGVYTYNYRTNPSPSCASLPWGSDQAKPNDILGPKLKEIMACHDLIYSKKIACLKAISAQLPEIKAKIVKDLVGTAKIDSRWETHVDFLMDSILGSQIEWLKTH